MAPTMRAPSVSNARAETRDWSRFMGLEVSVGGNASSNAERMGMGPIRFVVMVINQPVPRRSPVATINLGKHDTVTTIRAFRDNFMGPVQNCSFITDPLRDLGNHSNRNKCPRTGSTKLICEGSKGLLSGRWLCVARSSFHGPPLFHGDRFSVSKNVAKWPFSGASCCQDRGIGHRMS